MAREFSKKLYNSKEWKGIRDSILKRDKYICNWCGNPASEVHHLERITPGNIDKKETHKASNLISLCRDCHCREHDKHRKTLIDVADEYYFDEYGSIQKHSPPII